MTEMRVTEKKLLLIYRKKLFSVITEQKINAIFCSVLTDIFSSDMEQKQIFSVMMKQKIF